MILNWITKKIFRRDVEYVTIFLKFLIECHNRRLVKVQQGQLVDLNFDTNSFEKLKFLEFEKNWEMKIHYNRIFDSKDGLEWSSIKTSLKILNFGDQELINNEVSDMEYTLKMYINGWEETLGDVLNMKLESYIKRGPSDLNRNNYNINYIEPVF